MHLLDDYSIVTADDKASQIEFSAIETDILLNILSETERDPEMITSPKLNMGHIETDLDRLILPDYKGPNISEDDVGIIRKTCDDVV